jgi:hypothetical protein
MLPGVRGGDDIIGVGRFGQDGIQDALFEPDARPRELIAEIARQRPAGSK